MFINKTLLESRGDSLKKLLLSGKSVTSAVLIFVCAICTPVSSDNVTESDIQSCREELEKMLLENIIPFWYPRVLDFENGGYCLNHDMKGKWLGPINKEVVSQARTLWFFSRLCRTSYSKPEYLNAARCGFEFLSRSLWDDQYGGVFWEVNPAGTTSVVDEKHLCGQTFALFALSEYGMSTKSGRALDMSTELYELIEHYGRDHVHGGYFEVLARDWSPASSESQSFMNTVPEMKLAVTHLHLLEALATYFLASQNALARGSLFELILIESNTVTRPSMLSPFVTATRFTPNWKSWLGKEANYALCGFELKKIWILLQAAQTLNISPYLLLDFNALAAQSITDRGFDSSEGGFFDVSLHDLEKSAVKPWWIQAEALVSLLNMYLLTDEPRYFRLFSQTLNWISENLVDWEHGGWYPVVGENGPGGHFKADAWKTPYHNGRAIIVCIEMLDRKLKRFRQNDKVEK